MTRFARPALSRLAAATALIALPSLALAKVVDVPNASFEAGDLSDWSASGDVAALSLDPCLQPQLPSDGAFAACLSTASLFGGASINGARSDLVSAPVQLDFRPAFITVSFDYDYGSDETLDSVRFNDTVSITLLTRAGPLPVLISDTWGTTPSGKGLTRSQGSALTTPNPGCPVARQTGRITAKFTRSIPTDQRASIFSGPVQVQFSVYNQGDAAGLTFLCFDNLKLKISR